MKEYSYNDFINALDKTGQAVLSAINEHINSNYSEYKPFDIKTKDKSEKEWTMNYRKKPKIGRAICSVYSIDGKLSVRFTFLSSMAHAFLLRQNEFSEKIRRAALKQIICVVNKSCRGYGGNITCQWRQHFWLNNRLIKACPYPWVYLDGLDENDIGDIELLIDLQMNHMTQDSKDIKGGTYTEVNIQRCKEVQSIAFEEINLDIDVFQTGDHVTKTARLDKYVKLYNLVPMGENSGLWFYLSNDSVCGMNCSKNAYAHNRIPEGRYALVVIDDPFTFSLNRVWNYICKWAEDNNEAVNGRTLCNGEDTACFVKFNKEGTKELMTAYVPLKDF